MPLGPLHFLLLPGSGSGIWVGRALQGTLAHGSSLSRNSQNWLFLVRWGRQCSESHCTQQQVSKKAPTSSPPPRLHDLAPPPLTVLEKAPGNRPKLLCSSPWCSAFLLDRVCSSPFPCVIHLEKPKVGGRGQGKTGGRCTLSLIMLSDYPKIRK